MVMWIIIWVQCSIAFAAPCKQGGVASCGVDGNEVDLQEVAELKGTHLLQQKHGDGAQSVLHLSKAPTESPTAAPYHLSEKLKDCSDVASIITTSEECKEGAFALNKSMPWQSCCQNKTNVRYGCTIRKDPMGRHDDEAVFSNNTDARTAEQLTLGYRQICKGEAPTTPEPTAAPSTSEPTPEPTVSTPEPTSEPTMAKWSIESETHEVGIDMDADGLPDVNVKGLERDVEEVVGKMRKQQLLEPTTTL